MKKLLFISTYKNPSVLRDYGILKQHFQSRSLFFPNAKKTPYSVIRYFFSILVNVIWADVCFVRFADFRAFLAVIFSIVFRKKMAIAIGGYEVAKEYQFRYGALLSKNGERRIKFIIKHADIVIANSEFSKNEIKNLNINVDVHVINHGIEKTDSSTTKEDFIVTIGKLYEDKYEMKGIDTFVKAAGKLSVRAMVIGDFEESVYETLKSINPAIELTGYLPQQKIVKILKQAKVYCQLSYRESFGVALLEAMSLGCIPVVTKRTALPEVVGNVGFYTEFGDVQITSEAIDLALKSDQSSLVIDRVNQKFLLKYREEKLLKILADKKWI